uniref:ADP ribosyltransferase domain-containing protein n=1 Tax=viral metagenome TaxID=1070528 RepID=A0A6C0HW83_9ZZZZ
MKIDFEMIQKIFNRKIELKNEKDKIALSQYSDYIPMYDIFSDNIYPINSMKLYYRLVNCHYRFITDEIKQWIINKKDKLDTKTDKFKHYDNMLKIIDNYNLEYLEKTSYETLYRYSPDYGLSISICKRNSFHPYSFHLNPYYTKNELIKLGMNNKLIETLKPSDLVDKKLHYDICKLVSKNDISYETILNHMNLIIENKCVSWINFYSMTGSYLFNKILRDKLPINQYLYDGLNKIINCINKAELPNDYFFYRFVWDDDYLRNLKVGDVFIDKGFTSTTRDPFYSPGVKMDFGLVLVKINIPKKIKGVGLLIENFSLFPKEEEFLIQPFSKLKLVARNDKARYYHINEKFERIIKKKYEFDLVNINDNFNLKVEPDYKIPSIELHEININININTSISSRVDLFKIFLDKCDSYGQFRYNNEVYLAQWFDSTGSYANLYKNKTEDGFIIYKYKDGYPILSIEMAEELYVNFQKSVCYYDDNNNVSIDNNINVVSHIARIFKYKTPYVYFDYKNFTEFKDNYESEVEYLSIKLYCSTIYDYYKKNIKNENSYFKYEFGFWKLDNIGKESVSRETINKINKDIKDIKWKDFYILVVEKYFHLYKKLEEWMNDMFENMFNKNYYTFNILPYLNKQGYNIEEIPTLSHITSFDRGAIFSQVYRDNIRRVI